MCITNDSNFLFLFFLLSSMWLLWLMDWKPLSHDSSSDAITIKITELSVPKWIQNGTEARVVLDCEYSASKHLDKNITLKWYFQTFQDLNNNIDYANNGQHGQPSKPSERDLVYEWIPRFNFRYVATNFQQHFDWDFHFNSTGEHNGQAFRALPLLKPLVDHSGRYTCQVSSTVGVEEKTEDMLVFGK